MPGTCLRLLRTRGPRAMYELNLYLYQPISQSACGKVASAPPRGARAAQAQAPSPRSATGVKLEEGGTCLRRTAALTVQPGRVSARGLGFTSRARGPRLREPDFECSAKRIPTRPPSGRRSRRPKSSGGRRKWHQGRAGPLAESSLSLLVAQAGEIPGGSVVDGKPQPPLA